MQWSDTVINDQNIKGLKNDPECVKALYKFICLTNIHPDASLSPTAHSILKKTGESRPLIAQLKHQNSNQLINFVDEKICAEEENTDLLPATTFMESLSQFFERKKSVMLVPLDDQELFNFDHLLENSNRNSSQT